MTECAIIVFLPSRFPTYPVDLHIILFQKKNLLKSIMQIYLKKNETFISYSILNTECGIHYLHR